MIDIEITFPPNLAMRLVFPSFEVHLSACLLALECVRSFPTPRGLQLLASLGGRSKGESRAARGDSVYKEHTSAELGIGLWPVWVSTCPLQPCRRVDILKVFCRSASTLPQLTLLARRKIAAHLLDSTLLKSDRLESETFANRAGPI